MASQVQIPFEGVILQEHSAPISCPTPNFAKGSVDSDLIDALSILLISAQTFKKCNQVIRRLPAPGTLHLPLTTV